LFVYILLDLGFEIRDLEHIYDINHYIINGNISGSSSRLYSVDGSGIKMGKETSTLKKKTERVLSTTRMSARALVLAEI